MNAADLAQEQLSVQLYESTKAISLLQQVAKAGDGANDQSSASAIHDAVLRKSGITLSEAVSIQPHHIDTLDDRGFTPLHLAVLLDHLDAVQILVNLGADVNRPTGHYKATPLHFACPYHRAAIALTLMDHGSSVCAQNIYGQTPLHCTCVNPQITGHLLRLGGSHQIIRMRSCWGQTALRNLVLRRGSSLSQRSKRLHLETLKWTVTYKGLYRPPPPSLGEVVRFVERIVEQRELNWEAGLFLENKVKFDEDRSHARIKEWACQQRRQLLEVDKDGNNRDIICDSLDVPLDADVSDEKAWTDTANDDGVMSEMDDEMEDEERQGTRQEAGMRTSDGCGDVNETANASDDEPWTDTSDDDAVMSEMTDEERRGLP
ncbi:ankyrin repeat-containing domain protein [Apodospora peruviana]|uniref:Ankyrin repeat-containing domain protein n=1 Tax=Apodospora peruviana TaxID=516989 RepID=A0AAE0HTE6_9PEZI|nr:ankyrin repeat-containing domain protein [Apodospora peruviana]